MLGFLPLSSAPLGSFEDISYVEILWAEGNDVCASWAQIIIPPSSTPPLPMGLNVVFKTTQYTLHFRR